jgi:hypothetical protein
MLASEGLTDKEIAARLKLSPETVGTYWRRILSKYAAASRTEVVAKVVRLQAEAEVGHLTQVSEGLREVADHLLVVLRDQRPDAQDKALVSEAASILESIGDLVVAVDSEGFTSYTNRAAEVSVESGEPFEWALDPSDRDTFRETFSDVMADGLKKSLSLRLSTPRGGPVSFHALVARRQNNGVVIALRQN